MNAHIYAGINKDLGEYQENPRLDGWRFATARGKAQAAETLQNPKYNCHPPEILAKNLAAARRPRQDGGARASRMMGRAHEDSSGVKCSMDHGQRGQISMAPGCRSTRHLVSDWPDNQ